MTAGVLTCPDCGKVRTTTPQRLWAVRNGRTTERCQACRSNRQRERFAATRAQRFWAKVAKTDGCWTWQGGRTQRGYGTLKIASRHVPAHRVSWELTHGPIPNGLNVLHRCDNPPCVRPDHLFLGTQADNVADMLAKGRWAPRYKTVCVRGHELTAENRYHGTGACIACTRIRNTLMTERKRAERCARGGP